MNIVLKPEQDQFIQSQIDRDRESMLSLCLELITTDALTNPKHLETYTQEMAAEDEALLAGVVIDC